MIWIVCSLLGAVVGWLAVRWVGGHSGLRTAISMLLGLLAGLLVCPLLGNDLQVFSQPALLVLLVGALMGFVIVQVRL